MKRELEASTPENTAENTTMDGTLTKSQAIMEKAPIAKRQRLIKQIFGFLVGSAETQQKSGAVRKASESDKGTEVAYEKRGHSRQNSTVKVEKIAIDYKDERDVYNHGGTNKEYNSGNINESTKRTSTIVQPPRHDIPPPVTSHNVCAEQEDFSTRIESLQHELSQTKLSHDLDSAQKSQQISVLHQQLLSLEQSRATQQTQYDGWVQKLQADTEAEKRQYQAQIQKMSQIISDLSKRGLPLPPDDSYFSSEFRSLIADTRGWARAFTKGQAGVLTIEALRGFPLGEEMKGHLRSSFLDLKGLLVSPAVGKKARTRCVEALLLRGLTEYIHGRCIGFDKTLFAMGHQIYDSMSGSDQEKHSWGALTDHLLTKSSPSFQENQTAEINQITHTLHQQLLPFAGTSSRATKDGLRALVTKVANLGHLLSQAPFRVVPIEVLPGAEFEERNMEDIDEGEDEEEGEEGEGVRIKRKATIVLCPAWMKVEFDGEGRAVVGVNDESRFFAKAQVSCLA